MGSVESVRGQVGAGTVPATEREAGPERPALFEALAVPDYRRLWVGSLISNIGTWMQLIGSGWLVLQLTNSPFWLGVESFAAAKARREEAARG